MPNNLPPTSNSWQSTTGLVKLVLHFHGTKWAQSTAQVELWTYALLKTMQHILLHCQPPSSSSFNIFLQNKASVEYLGSPYLDTYVTFVTFFCWPTYTAVTIRRIKFGRNSTYESAVAFLPHLIELNSTRHKCTEDRFSVSFLCKADKNPQKLKLNLEIKKELFRNEYLSYGVKLEEDLDSLHPCLVFQSCSRYFLSFEKFRSSSRIA